MICHWICLEKQSKMQAHSPAKLVLLTFCWGGTVWQPSTFNFSQDSSETKGEWGRGQQKLELPPVLITSSKPGTSQSAPLSLLSSCSTWMPKSLFFINSLEAFMQTSLRDTVIVLWILPIFQLCSFPHAGRMRHRRKNTGLPSSVLK